ncbi:nuclear transport factor 2 family protein [Aequorivita sp. KMM 9714]|uniref:YybH family protein n=1 Tax=Aequorivita sp. KMM 9714 TaxID=2707173 RepID=UPI0013ECF5DC|nr:nuclear transport factor 2 family protein [Aequorivita sp. KMM 9714]NGX84446.1 nuclear transport factor 2 family protein [Aequorivita sp. KMM 9714]
MKKILLLFCLITTLTAVSQTEVSDKEAILSVLKSQEKAWNQFDLEGYMQGYWISDSLKFYGSSGLTNGWRKTLSNYKKSYPTKEHTGTLNFTIDAISKIEENSYHVMGQYHLVRKMGNANGVFLIIFKKIDGEWRIVADMSC